MDSSFLEVLKGLPFYFRDKPKDQQQGSFVGTVGPPVKHGIEHPLYDYEHEIIDYLERDEPTDPKSKHLYILKSAGLGITTLLLYYIGWKCTTNDSWKGGRVCILTPPRIELTIDIVSRFKKIFERWNEAITFDSRNTIASIYDVTIEAFPAHLGLKGMRGLTDIKMILYDEAAFFDFSLIGEAIDTVERYLAKSNPILVLCSTPNRPNDLLDLIKQQPEDECIYHRMYLPYTVGLDKIYTQQEIAHQKLSSSFLREYDLHFSGLIGNEFRTQDIDRAIELGNKYYTDRVNYYSAKTIGIDPSFGSSEYGICIVETINNRANVLFAEEYHKPDFNDMIEIAISKAKLKNRYGIDFEFEWISPERAKELELEQNKHSS